MNLHGRENLESNILTHQAWNFQLKETCERICAVMNETAKSIFGFVTWWRPRGSQRTTLFKGITMSYRIRFKFLGKSSKPTLKRYMNTVISTPRIRFSVGFCRVSPSLLTSVLTLLSPRLTFLPWRFKQNIRPKCWQTSQKTNDFIGKYRRIERD
jgi:hypothetical protein